MRPDMHIRTKHITHSPTQAVTPRVAEARAMGFEVVHLGFGQYRGLEQLKLRCPKPEGAYYLIPRLFAVC